MGEEVSSGGKEKGTVQEEKGRGKSKKVPSEERRSLMFCNHAWSEKEKKRVRATITSDIEVDFPKADNL